MTTIPTEVSHLIETVLHARKTKTSLNIVGGGTKCFYGE